MSVENARVVVVGASASGLATAACLQRAGVPHVLLEAESVVASAWRRHYDRLHLHTSRGLSGLPFLAMPRHFPKYPSRLQVIEYLESYRATMGLSPRFGVRVKAVTRAGDEWQVETETQSYRAPHVVLATGYPRVPVRPRWPGLEEFGGRVLHSSEYRSGAALSGQRVLVVGLGNSGGEIAIDLDEQGAATTLSVRSPVHVVPRDVLGIPILAVGIVMSKLPTKVADVLAKPITAATIGDLEPYGLRCPPEGPNEMIRRRGRIPLLDIGTVALVKQGRIAVRPGIERLTPEGVVFADGREEPFDAIVLATGFRPALEELLPDEPWAAKVDGVGRPATPQGLHLCGFHVSPIGMLRQIALEAREIADAIHSRGQVR